MTLEEKLQALRERWIEADPLEREHIEKLAAELKGHKCRICSKPTTEEHPSFPFCGTICHEVYKRENPKPHIEGKPQSMEDLKQRIEFRRQELIKSSHKPKQGGLL